MYGIEFIRYGKGNAGGVVGNDRVGGLSIR